MNKKDPVKNGLTTIRISSLITELLAVKHQHGDIGICIHLKTGVFGVGGVTVRKFHPDIKDIAVLKVNDVKT
jgi:hypothetical protein